MSVIKRATAAILAAALWAVTFSSPASAQQICFVRDDGIKQLGGRHGEQVTARGLAENGRAMMELLQSEGGSWTFVVTDVQGRSCVIASGEAWSEIKPQRGAPS